MKKFWNWVVDADSGARTLHFNGVISEETWWGDEITPGAFRSELFSGEGDISIYLNSPGGDCIAASQIYSMMMEYSGNITVKIDGIAASAASVIAMAGTTVLMAPTAQMMIHNPWTVAIGDSSEMEKAVGMLGEIKESIVNAYQIKTGQSRVKISHWMDAETWMNVNKAVELGFADGMLEAESHALPTETFAFSRRAVTNSLLDKLKPKGQATPAPKNTPRPEPKGVAAESLEKRLNLILH